MKRSYDELNHHHQNQRIQHSQSPHPAQSNHGASESPSAAPSISTPTELNSLPAIASLKATISSLPRVPQISRKVRACSACKKQKIRCDFDADAGENGKCVRCRKMKLECVVNRSLQTILDEDVEWKMKMTEELSQLQRAVEDILKTKQMRPLSAYSSPTHSAASSCSPGLSMATLFSGNSPTVKSQNTPLGRYSSSSTVRSPDGNTPGRITLPPPSQNIPAPAGRMPMTRENTPDETPPTPPPMLPPLHIEGPGTPTRDRGPEDSRLLQPPTDGSPTSTRPSSKFYEQHYSALNSASLSTNPMGSLYEVTKLRSLRSNSTANVTHHHPPGDVHLPAVAGMSGSGGVSSIMNVPSIGMGGLGGGRHTLGPSALGRNNTIEGSGDDDLITRGLVSLEEAEELFDLFRSTLNHYLFDVALIHDNLTAVRQSSSLLLASILTVSSLHRPASNSKANTPPPTTGTSNAAPAATVVPSGTFGVCYQHFLSLVSASMFDFTAAQSGPQSYTRALDNVRALSIAAFWLPDLSWKLSGHAVRIATELNVHQSYRKALKTTPIGSKLTEAERMRRDQERKFHYERARLWYLLYVCDHHFSIAYGRPPVICYSQHEAIRDEGFERYLESDLCKEGDFRVVSQLALFVVLERIYECFAGEISEGGMVREEVLFGIDNSDTSDDDLEHVREGNGFDAEQHSRAQKKRKVDPPEETGGIKKHTVKVKRRWGGVKNATSGKVEQFNRELDEWRDIWCPRLRKNAFVGDYPAKGVLLHYHFAKLQLNSLALRGVTALSTSEMTSAQIIGAFGPQRTAMARLAIQSATHVLTTILTVEEIRVCLIGVPLYVHTMIAFAAVFLMKVVSRWRNVPNIADLLNPAQQIWMLVGKVVEVLRDVAGGGIKEGGPTTFNNKTGRKGASNSGNSSAPADAPSLRGAGEMHIVWYIAGGLEKMIKKCSMQVMREDQEEEEARRASGAAPTDSAQAGTQGESSSLPGSARWTSGWSDAGDKGTLGRRASSEDPQYAKQPIGTAAPAAVPTTSIDGGHIVEPKHEDDRDFRPWATHAQHQHAPGAFHRTNSPHHSQHDQYRPANRGLPPLEPTSHLPPSQMLPPPPPPPPPPIPPHSLPPLTHHTPNDSLHHGSYAYTTTAPGASSHPLFAFDPIHTNHHQHHHHPHHEGLTYDPHHTTGASSLFTLPTSSIGPYEFFNDPTSAAVQTQSSVGYFSFNGFDLFGGGTMEAIPMAGETGAIRLDVDAGPLLSGAYATFLHPSSGIPTTTGPTRQPPPAPEPSS